jgi:hypothetical protein
MTTPPPSRLDARIAEMVETMVGMAEAETTPRKLGRSKLSAERMTL